MAKLYFIGGASGSGKSVIFEGLKTKLGKAFIVYDFDDIGVPEDADIKWRQESTEKWLQTLLVEDKDVVLLGQVVLGEILACPSAKKLDKFNYCLLDVTDIERVKRLESRHDGVDQWAAWLRMHHQDPQWEQHVVTKDSWQGLDFSAWEALDHWDSRANMRLLDTTGMSIDTVIGLVADFIIPPVNQVIFLNGPSSSGKTSVAKKLQDMLMDPYLHIGIDKIIGMMPQKLNDWDGNKVEQGFWWEYAQDEEGHKLAYIKLGTFAQQMSSLLKKVVLTALENGHKVIIDEVCVVKGSFDEWRRVLLPYGTLYVALKSDTESLEKRENTRNDRTTGSARAQNMTVHQGVEYDLELDTGVLSLEECVHQIGERV